MNPACTLPGSFQHVQPFSQLQTNMKLDSLKTNHIQYIYYTYSIVIVSGLHIREDDLLDIAPFLGETSRLGETYSISLCKVHCDL